MNPRKIQTEKEMMKKKISPAAKAFYKISESLDNLPGVHQRQIVELLGNIYILKRPSKPLPDDVKQTIGAWFS